MIELEIGNGDLKIYQFLKYGLNQFLVSKNIYLVLNYEKSFKELRTIKNRTLGIL